MLLAFVVGILLLCLVDYLWRRDTNAKLPKTVTPLFVPIIGHMWYYFRRKPEEIMEMSQDVYRSYGRTVKFWILHIPGIVTSELPYVQEILSQPVEIKKNRMYDLLTGWLSDGLLLSNGAKWLGRRRVITPTFHFQILEQFIKIFDKQTDILVKKLEKHANGRDIIDVHDYVALATLDVICESAMGVRINAQTDEHCEYVRLLLDLTKIIITRFVNISYRIDPLFAILAPKLAKQQKEVTKALHDFTENIIMERRTEVLEHEKLNNENNEYGIKERKALLDVLLSSTIDGKPLSNDDIREEVDTFMFEGHDTTKSGIGFTLYCLSREPAVQQKVYEEIQAILGAVNGGGGGEQHEELNYAQLNDLKYTELVIKEALRMYPPVPFIGREIMQDCYINGSCFPKGTSVILAIYTMHHDEKYFPEPERFLPERATNANAFAYVPFSAGPRNCIGQRFAMLEMKAFIAKIIQSYELLPLGEKVVPRVNVVLNSKTGWQMGFRKRI